MIFRFHIFILCLMVCNPAVSDTKLRLLMTLPDFVQLGQEIGGEFVTVDSFLDGSEDPHFVDAVPSFISKAAKADVVCSAGLDLEIGWLPRSWPNRQMLKFNLGEKVFVSSDAQFMPLKNR